MIWGDRADGLPPALRAARRHRRALASARADHASSSAGRVAVHHRRRRSASPRPATSCTSRRDVRHGATMLDEEVVLHRHLLADSRGLPAGRRQRLSADPRCRSTCSGSTARWRSSPAPRAGSAPPWRSRWPTAGADVVAARQQRSRRRTPPPTIARPPAGGRMLLTADLADAGGRAIAGRRRDRRVRPARHPGQQRRHHPARSPRPSMPTRTGTTVIAVNLSSVFRLCRARRPAHARRAAAAARSSTSRRCSRSRAASPCPATPRPRAASRSSPRRSPTSGRAHGHQRQRDRARLHGDRQHRRRCAPTPRAAGRSSSAFPPAAGASRRISAGAAVFLASRGLRLRARSRARRRRRLDGALRRLR